jgi:hypothetical protein
VPKALSAKRLENEPTGHAMRDPRLDYLAGAQVSDKAPDGADESQISIIVDGVAGGSKINAFSVELFANAGPYLREIFRNGTWKLSAKGPMEDGFPIRFHIIVAVWRITF